MPNLPNNGWVCCNKIWDAQMSQCGTCKRPRIITGQPTEPQLPPFYLPPQPDSNIRILTLGDALDLCSQLLRNGINPYRVTLTTHETYPLPFISSSLDKLQIGEVEHLILRLTPAEKKGP